MFVKTDTVDTLCLLPVFVNIYHKATIIRTYFIFIIIICKWIRIKEAQLDRLFKPNTIKRLHQQRIEVRSQSVAVCTQILTIGGSQSHIIQMFTAIRKQSLGDIAHILSYNLYAILAQIGIYPTMIQNTIRIIMLLWHTHDTTYCLCAKFRTLDVAEYQKYGCTRTIPTQSNGLLEE